MTGIEMIPSSSSTRLRAGAETFLMGNLMIKMTGEAPEVRSDKKNPVES